MHVIILTRIHTGGWAHRRVSITFLTQGGVGGGGGGTLTNFLVLLTGFETLWILSPTPIKPPCHPKNRRWIMAACIWRLCRLLLEQPPQTGGYAFHKFICIMQYFNFSQHVNCNVHASIFIFYFKALSWEGRN